MLDIKTLVSSDTVFLAWSSSLEKSTVNTGLMMAIEIGDLLGNWRELLGSHDLSPRLEAVLHLRWLTTLASAVL